MILAISGPLIVGKDLENKSILELTAESKELMTCGKETDHYQSGTYLDCEEMAANGYLKCINGKAYTLFWDDQGLYWKEWPCCDHYCKWHQ